MSKASNEVFLIVIGVCIVLALYIGIKTNLPGKVGKMFTDTQNIVNKADDGSTPGTATVKSTESTEDSFTITYSLADNATRYRCNYGKEKGRMKDTGVIYMDKNKVTCKATHLEGGTKYYVELVTINLDIATSANLTSVTTK